MSISKPKLNQDRYAYKLYKPKRFVGKMFMLNEIKRTMPAFCWYLQLQKARWH